MIKLIDVIKGAEKRKVAVGHFNVSDIAALRAIMRAVEELRLPVIIGFSEGERDFIGAKQAAALIESFRGELDLPIFLNADHTYSLSEIKEAVAVGFDAVIFDGAKLSFSENIKRTKEVVKYVKSVNPNVLVEGELGYIGSSSKILEEIPEGAAIKEEDLTKPEEAARFVKETGIDLLAPAVGNIHGMFKNAFNPDLNVERIREIREAAGVPLVLHGGSGIKDKDFLAAIDAGISIVHINTEIRLAWRKGLELDFKEDTEEVAPYKLLKKSEEAIYEVVKKRLELFNKLH